MFFWGACLDHFKKTDKKDRKATNYSNNQQKIITFSTFVQDEGHTDLGSH
jgi:hypothetical protein